MKATISSLLLLGLIISCYMANTGVAAEDDEDDKLVLYLPFDDDDKPEDLSPKESPIASFIRQDDVVEGIKGNAWLFDQSTCILLDAQTFNDAFQQSTFSVWLKSPGKNGIIYEEGGGTNGHAVALIKGEVEFATRNTNQTAIKAEYPDDDDWHFVTTVFDRGTMRLYIDGELLKEETKVAGIGGHGDEMGIGKINGASSGNNTSKFTGIMDEFRITRRALSTEEIGKAYEDMIRSLAIEPSGKYYVTWGGIRGVR